MKTLARPTFQVGALRIMPIAAHVTKAWQARLALLADEPGRFHLGYGLVPVMVRRSLRPLGDNVLTLGVSLLIFQGTHSCVLHRAPPSQHTRALGRRRR